MSTLVMSACWPLQMPPTPKAVLISLADNANDHGHCWPSLTKICERTCFKRTAVIDAIKWLETQGFLKADRSNGRHSRYQITPNADIFTTQNQSGKRTGTGNEPVRLAHLSAQNQSGKRTGTGNEPVRQTDTNRQEPRSKAIPPISPKKRKGTKTTFDDWTSALGNGYAIAPDDPIFTWADDVGVPRDWLALAWQAFCERYGDGGLSQAKRYADWRAVFRNAVKGDWLKVWRIFPDGATALTTVGEQLRRKVEADAQPSRSARVAA